MITFRWRTEREPSVGSLRGRMVCRTQNTYSGHRQHGHTSSRSTRSSSLLEKVSLHLRGSAKPSETGSDYLLRCGRSRMRISFDGSRLESRLRSLTLGSSSHRGTVATSGRSWMSGVSYEGTRLAGRFGVLVSRLLDGWRSLASAQSGIRSSMRVRYSMSETYSESGSASLHRLLMSATCSLGCILDLWSYRSGQFKLNQSSRPLVFRKSDSESPSCSGPENRNDTFMWSGQEATGWLLRFLTFRTFSKGFNDLYSLKSGSSGRHGVSEFQWGLELQHQDLKLGGWCLTSSVGRTAIT